MTTPRILVTYGSKNGGTAEIAQWIGETLREDGFDVDVLPVSAVQDVQDYTAVVLGSALYEGRWLREVTRFARHHYKVLLHVPVWLFSSGPLDASAAVGDLPAVKDAAGIADDVEARGHITFGGRLVPGGRGLLARLLLRQGKGGDFRDADQVRGWAEGIARDLSAGPPSS